MSDKARNLALAVVAVGWPEPHQQTAVAVALAELGPYGFDVVVKDNPKGRTDCTSHGAFQINYCPGRDDGNPNRDPKLVDHADLVPHTKAALAIAGGGGNFQPWTTYRKGSHRKHLAAAADALRWAKTDSSAQFLVEQMRSGQLRGGGYGSGGPGIGDLARDPMAAAGILNAALNPMEAAGRLLSMLTSWDTWRRVLFALVGLGLVAAALALIISDQAT